jgi:hypothetical protein
MRRRLGLVGRREILGVVSFVGKVKPRDDYPLKELSILLKDFLCLRKNPTKAQTITRLS